VASSILFKDLQKLVSQSQQQKENLRKELFQKLYNKSFWIWDKQQHKQEDIRTNGDCCFNHIIGQEQQQKKGQDLDASSDDNCNSDHGNDDQLTRRFKLVVVRKVKSKK
jgi:hypothetical protein